MQQQKKTGAIPWLAEQLFGTPDRKVATFFGALSVLFGLLSLLLVASPKAVPAFIVIRDVILYSLLVATIVVGSYFYARRGAQLKDQEQLLKDQTQQLENQQQLAANQLEDQRQLLANRAKIHHEIVHAFRDVLFGRYHQPDVARAAMTRQDVEVLQAICDETTFQVQRALREHFTAIDPGFTDEVSVTVKLVATPEEVANKLNAAVQRLGEHASPELLEKIKGVHGNDKWIMTVWRDQVTYKTQKAREVGGDIIYDVDKTTPYRLLVREGVEMFVCDDLASLGTAYQNDNKRWREFYNASLAVPIRYVYPDPYMRAEPRCYGILAADSPNRKARKPLFNTPECKTIMEYAADLLAIFFLTLELSRPVAPSNQDQQVSPTRSE